MSLKIIFNGLIVLFFTVHAQGLRCYSCFGTGPDNECEKYETYVEAMDGKRDELKKNCTAPHNQVCIRELFTDRGNTVSHIRDCNNGKTFSFNSSIQNERGAYDRLFDLAPNNETSCVYDGLNMVCLSMCFEDFCNGPQLEEKLISGYDVTRLSVIVLVLAKVVAFII